MIVIYNQYMKELRSRKGQIVPLILLIVLVGATIGFSIAGTAIRNIQQTALTEESERAYTAAEAGLEQVLLELENTGTANAINTPINLSSGAQIKKVEVTPIRSLNIANLPKDEVAQINLSNPSYVPVGTEQLRLVWDNTAALVITKIGTGVAPDPYTVTRWAVYCGVAARGDNFDLATVFGTNQCEMNINFDPTVDLVLRIRTMYSATSLTAEPTILDSLPVQSTRLVSTGQSGEAERTVQVERSAPVPPAILDYVLFSSQGSLTK